MTREKRREPCLRVPVRIVDDDCVGRCERDALPARPRGQQEHKAVGALCGRRKWRLIMTQLDRVRYGSALLLELSL